ncbi:MAG: tetratricopeptide repeat protein [Burkholderiales bacterium]
MLKSFFTRRATSQAPDLLARAAALHTQGQLDEAERVYDAAIAAEPGNFDALHMRGVLAFQRGRHDEAMRLIDAALRVKPDAAALANRGLVLQAQGRLADALASMDAALVLAPRSVDGWVNRGRVLSALARHDEAVASVDRALALSPDHAPAHVARAGAMHTAGRLGEAIASYEAALELRPDDAATWIRLGGALHGVGRADDSIVAYDHVLAADDDNAVAWNARAHALASLGRWADAVADFGRAIAIDPFFVDALVNRGNALHEQQRDDESLADYDTALQFAPDCVAAWYNQGVVLQSLRRLPEAIVSYDRALALDPRHVDAHYNRGIALGKLNRGDEARVAYDEVIALDPDFPYVLGQAAYARAELCDWNGYAELAARALDGVRRGRVACDPFVLLGLADDPAAHRACAALHAARQIPRVPPLAKGAHYAHGRIRVAYLSANFCAHAVAYLIAELFELSDRARFELTAISFGPDDGSAMLARIRSAFDRFIDVRSLSDAAVARQMHELEIDIAVDLMGFTREGRPGILAYRPAPIQVNMLGYPGTMGADFIDYIIADPFLVAEADELHYAERVVRLPHTYQPNDRKRPIDERTPTRAEAGLPEHGFVFCCFNNNYKITPAVFDIWMRLLAAVPDSVLWLLPLSPAVTANLQREALARGVDARRLVFAPRVTLPEHLARQRLADLFLDTLPYNAHTTASDALWAGLPIVTCTGRSFGSRVAGSLLRAVGLPELVTPSLAAYEALALALAREPARLAEVRTRLARNRLAMPLFDSDGYRRHLEAAYRTMMEIHGRGEPPRSFEVAAGAG